MYIYICIYICVYIYIYIYIATSKSILKKRGMKIDNLLIPHFVSKYCTSCHKEKMVLAGRAHCFHELQLSYSYEIRALWMK